MTGYIDDVVDEIPNDVATPMVSPTSEYLFRMNKSGERLSEERSILFHRIISKLMFVRKSTRPDIHPTVAFLNTRLQYVGIYCQLIPD